MARYGHDILHCPNYECEKAQRCYRHQAYNEAREMSLTIPVQANSDKHCVEKGYRFFIEDDTDSKYVPLSVQSDF